MQPIDSQVPNPSENLSDRLWELARIFSRLGVIGFGGPQAHIAMESEEAVVRRQWLTPDQFSEGLAVCEMLPGPASTQMGIYIGYCRAGQLGALVAGLCFIAPAYLIVLMFSWAYFQFQTIPQSRSLFLGISPVVIAIMVGFCWNLGKKILKEWAKIAIAVIVFGLSWLLRINLLLLFAGAALIGMWLNGPKGPQFLKPKPKSSSTAVWILSLGGMDRILAPVPAEVLTLSSFWGMERFSAYALPLLLYFLKVGSVIYGGGLVIIPFLSEDVVSRLHWLTATEFLDGVAIGQITPGPVVLTAAFIGYKVAGVLGSLIATVGIFTPSFLLIMLAAPILLRMRKNPWIKAALQGVTPAALGAIAAAAIPLAQNTLLQETMIQSFLAVGIGVAALVALLRFKRPTWQLVPAGAVLGALMSFFFP